MSLARAGVQRVEQRPVGDRAGDLGGHDRRLGPDDGHLRDGVLLQDRDRLGDGLVGVGVHQVGQPAVLAAQHLADGLGLVALRLGREAVLRQPLVVEDLGQVAAAAVGEEYDDDRVGPALGGELLGELARGERRHAGRAADEHRLLAGQPPGEGERVARRRPR